MKTTKNQPADQGDERIVRVWVWRVTDGSRRKPCGHIGYADSREGAIAMRAARCRMGGYITRESSAAPPSSRSESEEGSADA